MTDSTNPKPPLERVSKSRLLDIYNTEYAPRVANGELRGVVEGWSHPSPPKAVKPNCTTSEYVVYKTTEGVQVVGGHRYVDSSGKVLTKNGLDPKWVYFQGVIYGAS